MPTIKTIYTPNDKYIWFITWLFLVMYNVSEANASAIMLGFAVLMLFSINFKLEIHTFHIMTLQFCLFCYASAFWAWNGRLSLEKGNTIFSALVCVYIFFSYYSKLNDIMILLKIIMWSGYFVVFYTYLFYGFSNVVAAEDSQRLNSEFANVNSVAMMVSLVMIIHYYFYLYERHTSSIVLAIPGLMIIAATQSRKAIVMLILGVILLYVFKQIFDRKVKLPFIKIFGFLIATIIVIILLRQTSLFAGLNTRMEGMIASITGHGEVDSSSSLRDLYRNLGWNQFYETPLGGIGIGNSRILVGRAVGYDCYLHDNYAELASGGGILGLISYYIIYLYVFFKEMRYIRKDKSVILVEVWLLIKLITDFGAVSYFSKSSYIYAMFFYLHLVQMQRKYSLKKKRT